MVRRMDAASSTDALKPKRNPVSSSAVMAGRDESSVRDIILGIAGEIEDSGPEAHLIDPVCKDHRDMSCPIPMKR